MAETWVINENGNMYEGDNFIINFMSNGQSFTFMKYEEDEDPMGNITLFIRYNDINAKNLTRQHWTDQAYRTVYFPIPPTGDLRTWLTNNAELQ